MSMFRRPQVILFSDDVTRVAEGTPLHIDLVLDAYRLGFSSVESTRDDHGLDPVTEGLAG